MSRLRKLSALLPLCLAACVGYVPAWEQPQLVVDDQPVVPRDRLLRTELDNGLTILVLEDHALPKVGMGLAVRRGAAAVPIAQAGLASFTAELMERGAGDRDALALAEAVDRVGGSFGVSAGWDSMEASVSGLSLDQEHLFGVLMDLVLRPRFAAGEANKVRAETLASLEQSKDDPQTLVGWYAARAIYGENHRFGFPIVGTQGSVKQLNERAARDLHARYFVPGNAILWAVGDLDPQAFVASARDALGDWEARPVPDAAPAPPDPAPAGRRVLLVDRPELEQAQLVVGHDGLKRTDPERIPASLMNMVLGSGGFSSRLMTTIREEEGLAYGVHSLFSLRRQKGPFVVGTATRVAEARRTIDLMLEELEGMRETPASEFELSHAKSFSTGRFALGLETPGSVLSSLVNLDIYGLPEDSLDTYRRRVRGVSLEQAAETARRRLHPERAAIVVVGPADKLAPSLEGLGTVQIVQP